MMNKLSEVDVVKRVLALMENDPLYDAKRHTWDFRRRALRKEMFDHGGRLNDFYSWPTIHDAFLSGATIDNATLYYNYLSRTHQAVAVDPPLGSSGVDNVRRLSSGATGTYIRQAYAAQLAEEALGSEPYHWNEVFEFGGGFGALAYVLARLGFQDRHMIYDFPECSLLQEWYHSRLDLDNVVYLNEPKELTPATSSCTIFFSLCALDEAPVAIREHILSTVSAELYFIWYTKGDLSNTVANGDNTSWFSQHFSDVGAIVEQHTVPNENQAILIAHM